MKRIAFTGDPGFSSKYFRGSCNNEKIKEMISKVKKKCRFCIVVVHSGSEFCALI